MLKEICFGGTEMNIDFNPFKEKYFEGLQKEIFEKQNEFQEGLTEQEKEEKRISIDRFFKRNNFDAKIIQKMWQTMGVNHLSKCRLFVLCYEVNLYLSNQANEKLRQKYLEYVKLFSELYEKISYMLHDYTFRKHRKWAVVDALKELIKTHNALMSQFILFTLDETSVLKGYSFENEETNIEEYKGM